MTEEMSDRERFAKSLRAARKAQRMTQEELAAATGMNRELLSRYERAERSPGIENIFRLARGLRMKAGTLIDYKFD